MPNQLPDASAEIDRQLRIRRGLHWISWILVSGALAWFIARERLPEWFADRPGGIPLLLAAVGALGGAMLVGAKLALRRGGNRPPLRDMILLILAPALILFFGSLALNRYGGEPPRDFIGPVAETRVEKPGSDQSDVQVKTLSPEGKTQWRTVAHDAQPGEVAALLGGTGYRRGMCVHYRYKTGSLGMRVDLDSRPVRCPPSKGTHAAEGPVMVEIPDPKAPDGWRWAYQLADPGPGFDRWQDALSEQAFRHLALLDGKKLQFRAKLEPDGAISAAVLVNADVLPSIADALSQTLVGRTDVLKLPPEGPHGEAIWVDVPGTTSVSLSPSSPRQARQGSSSEESP